MLVQLRVIGIIRFPVRSTYIELNEPSSNIGVIFQAAKIVTEIYISFRDTGDFSARSDCGNGRILRFPGHNLLPFYYKNRDKSLTDSVLF